MKHWRNSDSDSLLISSISKGINAKNPYQLPDKGFIKVASTYSPTLKRAVPSALTGLTSLFGMGRGGPRCNRHLNSLSPDLCREHEYFKYRLQIVSLQIEISTERIC